jgi:hypothetical protein
MMLTSGSSAPIRNRLDHTVVDEAGDWLKRPADWDEFTAAHIARAERIRDLFSARFLVAGGR